MDIHLFDFVDNYYPKLKNLNVLTTLKWTKPNKTSVESSHPPKENILIKIGNDLVKASPFKLPPPKILEKDENRKIIEQNNYTNIFCLINSKISSEFHIYCHRSHYIQHILYNVPNFFKNIIKL